MWKEASVRSIVVNQSPGATAFSICLNVKFLTTLHMHVTHCAARELHDWSHCTYLLCNALSTKCTVSDKWTFTAFTVGTFSGGYGNMTSILNTTYSKSVQTKTYLDYLHKHLCSDEIEMAHLVLITLCNLITKCGIWAWNVFEVIFYCGTAAFM